jgi:hypothetical protein
VFEKDASSVGQQMVFGPVRDRLDQSPLELTLQIANDLTNALKAETTAAKLANNSNFGEIFQGVQAAMTFARRLHNAALVPPLQLACAQARQLLYLHGCPLFIHRGRSLLQSRNISYPKCLEHNNAAFVAVNVNSSSKVIFRIP